MSELTDILGLGKDPITPDKPAGESVQFDPDYEALRIEVQKLDSVTQESVDWGSVVEKGTDILKNRSKHLLVSSYIAVALLERSDYAGLAAGLTILRDLIANFWDTMEPPPARKRGRIEAILWLGERGGKRASDRKPGGDEKDALVSCSALMKEIQSALQSKLGDEAPGFGELERVVKEHIATAEAAAKAAEAKKAQAAKIAAGEIDESASPEDARRVLGRLGGPIKIICDILRRANPADPVPYRLIRAVTWVQHRDLPPHANGTTQIPSPSAELAARLNDLLNKGDWRNLVEGAETAFPNAPLWFDVHYWSASALAAQGGAHVQAQEAVVWETANLMARCSGIADLKFANGTPFASSETQRWLAQEVLPLATGERKGQSGAGRDSLPPGLTEALQDAKRMSGRGQFAEAVRVFQEGIGATGERRAQFLWRLEMARLCLDGGQPALAAPLLEELEAQIQAHDLEGWEPHLCVSAYTALLMARRALLKDQRRATPELIQKTNQLHDRLVRLNLGVAMSLDGK